MFTVDNALDGIFLGCFLVGVLLAVISAVFGFLDLGGDAGGSGHGHDFGHEIAGLFNFSSILAFVTFFGAFGYLTYTGLGMFAIVSLVIAIAAGVAGAYLMTRAMRKLRSGEQTLDPRDYELPGTLAHVTSGIRVGGVGEIIYEQQGVRQVSAARSLDGKAIGRGTEVIVMRTVGGIALVQSFDEVLAEQEAGEPERDPNRLPVT